MSDNKTALLGAAIGATVGLLSNGAVGLVAGGIIGLLFAVVAYGYWGRA